MICHFLNVSAKIRLLFLCQLNRCSSFLSTFLRRIVVAVAVVVVAVVLQPFLALLLLLKLLLFVDNKTTAGSTPKTTLALLSLFVSWIKGSSGLQSWHIFIIIFIIFGVANIVFRKRSTRRFKNCGRFALHCKWELTQWW